MPGSADGRSSRARGVSGGARRLGRRRPGRDLAARRRHPRGAALPHLPRGARRRPGGRAPEMVWHGTRARRRARWTPAARSAWWPGGPPPPRRCAWPASTASAYRRGAQLQPLRPAATLHPGDGAPGPGRPGLHQQRRPGGAPWRHRAVLRHQSLFFRDARRGRRGSALHRHGDQPGLLSRKSASAAWPDCRWSPVGRSPRTAGTLRRPREPR